MPDDCIESIPLTGGRTLKIFPDPEVFDPRADNDNFGHMICFHRRYTLGDKTDLRSDQFSSWADIENHIITVLKARVILPIYMIDHSGLSIRTYDFSDIDPGCWDSGQIGFIYCTAEDIRKNFNVKRISKNLIKKSINALLYEISAYDQYLRGEGYGFNVIDPAGEIVDSCWGFDSIKTITDEFKERITSDHRT